LKSINQIFKYNTALLDEPEVQELVEYCKELEDEVVDLRQTDVSVMEGKLAEVVRDIYHSTNKTIKEDEEAIRFRETERVDFNEVVLNLRKFLIKFATDNQFNF
jgi:translation initiation factor 2B subunit (eIF-2B alpha/beta/delta family)